jgi:sugar phosphate isomerase/epimerase
MPEWPVGVQSFTYRNFTNDEIRSELRSTPVSAIELCGAHVDPFEDDGAAIADRYAEAGIDVCGFGVHTFDDGSDVDPVLDFAVDLGAAYVSIHVDPEHRDTIEALDAAADQRDLLLAVHNHGPGHVHDTVEDVQAVLEGTGAHFGACVDSGHYFRSGLAPETVVPAFGERVHAVHVKDFVDEETEVVPGEGQLDVAGFVELLRTETAFDQPLVIEYEEDPDHPTPAVVDTAERLIEAQPNR